MLELSLLPIATSSTLTVVCVAGQCLEGFSNTTLGMTISASGAQTSALLLPGQYTTTTDPELLHGLLTSSSASLSPSTGFNSSSVSLPLNVALEPGLAIYSNSLYGGSAGFSSLPTSPVGNSSTPLSAQSLALSSNIWAAIDVGSTNRVVFWDSVPDFSQLAVSGSLSLVDMQSSACEPACSSNGICSSSGTCSCAAGFTGASCESCESGFFGLSCQACPSGCLDCDDGTSGTGKCLAFNITNAPSSCNCLNGECGSNGQCSCNAGWTTADNGTACAKCASGFFLTSSGDCKICEIGCSACADITGDCQTCKTGFTQDANDQTKCDAEPTTTSSGTVCPDGSFSSGTTCSTCSPSCQTCNGATSNDCIICASGSYAFNGSCITADSNGVCEGTGLIADNNKKECDTCGAKCTSCGISGFTTASTVNQLQCTGCLPGSFLSNGSCVSNCPAGTFISSQDNTTCSVCDSSCSTCAGSSTFCLTCANGELASNGQCVSTCPANTVAANSTKTCLNCHPDCVSCSGTAFNQCLSCPPDRPVLNEGRCLPVCGKSQFFDSTSGSCQACDSSCSSCSGSGSSNCLACSSSSQVLKGGSCVSANCNGTADVVTGLGVCLSDLVVVPQASGSAAPLPSITGLTQPTVVTQTSSKRLQWWEILLMALGCAFIFLAVIWCWRRRARKQRAKRTKAFAKAKNLDQSTSWRWRLVRFGEKLFGHRASKRAHPEPTPDVNTGSDSEALKLMKLRNAEEARHHQEMEKLMLISDYQYPPEKRSSYYPPSVLPSLYDVGHFRNHLHAVDSAANRLSGPSLYSQVTGVPRNGPEARQPVKKDLITSRFSESSLNSSAKSRDLTRPHTPAEQYAMDVRSDLLVDTSTPEHSSQHAHWIQPTHTGATVSSKNPFRR
ncbi:growth factor receptor domain-containing protein [Lentinula aff. lateritia]|uniref:Growth factor receptor domain-containing protein n=1 Tax=Lentinula aff. lateritia TaxID=2804960 RepID=A0ACC1U1Q2_9AGAR|nr:growth factor receptor domain-containing protein [Lentinula aff. lateritia]